MNIIMGLFCVILVADSATVQSRASLALEMLRRSGPPAPMGPPRLTHLYDGNVVRIKSPGAGCRERRALSDTASESSVRSAATVVEVSESIKFSSKIAMAGLSTGNGGTPSASTKETGDFWRN